MEHCSLVTSLAALAMFFLLICFRINALLMYSVLPLWWWCCVYMVMVILANINILICSNCVNARYVAVNGMVLMQKWNTLCWRKYRRIRRRIMECRRHPDFICMKWYNAIHVQLKAFSSSFAGHNILFIDSSTLHCYFLEFCAFSYLFRSPTSSPYSIQYFDKFEKLKNATYLRFYLLPFL